MNPRKPAQNYTGTRIGMSKPDTIHEAERHSPRLRYLQMIEELSCRT
jgi:hypothetical protein